MCFNRKRTKLSDNAGATKKQLKKTNTYKILEEKEVLDANVRSIEYLIELAENYDNIKAELKVIYDRLKFSSPSSAEKIASFDKKIANKLDDVKIKLSKAKVSNEDEILAIIREIKNNIAERNSLI